MGFSRTEYRFRCLTRYRDVTDTRTPYARIDWIGRDRRFVLATINAQRLDDHRGCPAFRDKCGGASRLSDVLDDRTFSNRRLFP